MSVVRFVVHDWQKRADSDIVALKEWTVRQLADYVREKFAVPKNLRVCFILHGIGLPLDDTVGYLVMKGDIVTMFTQ